MKKMIQSRINLVVVSRRNASRSFPMSENMRNLLRFKKYIFRQARLVKISAAGERRLRYMDIFFEQTELAMACRSYNPKLACFFQGARGRVLPQQLLALSPGKQPQNKQESGIALIAVLCMVLVVSILVASSVAISQYAALETSTFSGFSRSFYIAEGAAARAYWLLMADRREHTNRTLMPQKGDIVDEERYIANSMVHNLDYYGRKVSFHIEDAIGGIDISGISPESNLTSLYSNRLSGKKEQEEFAKFCAKLHDYADGDDLLGINGMEKNGYQQDELYNLPRNSKLQFTQEIMHIPDFAEYFNIDKYGRVPMFRLIPPENLPKVNGRASLFASPLALIRNKCKLSDIETEQVATALKKWRTENIPLTDSLEPGLQNRLLLYFSTVESGYYTLVVNTAGENQPGTTLICSFQYNPRATASLQYHQFTFY